MTVKLFVLGCSGSGKSTAAHHVVKHAQDKGYSAIHVNDYEILYKMFQADKEPKGGKFRPTAYYGFDVIDLTVYDKALMQLEQAVLLSSSQANDFIILEFARDDYSKALSLFSKGFLKDAYFLFLDSDPDTCISRIHSRVIHRTTIDDHFVPEHIIRAFNKSNKHYLASGLKTDYSVMDERVKIIDNSYTSLDFFKVEVTKFAESIFQRERYISSETEQLPRISATTPADKTNKKARLLQDTEPIQIVAPVDDSVES